MTATYALGRHVHHDPRSRGFPAATAPTGPSSWKHYYGPLNQGQLGSCTGNAAAQCLMTSPLYRKGRRLSEAKALAIYERATTLDDTPGTYPPDDTGSSGLAAAKACQQLGYIGSYTHAFGVDHAIGALRLSPFICGTDWYESMFTPTESGFVRPAGQVAGGHEYLCVGYDGENFAFVNSWGRGWGIAIPGLVSAGAFKMRSQDFATLLDAQGDVTVFGVPA